MPRNGSGTFIPTPSSVYPAVANTVIDPVAFNTLEQDFSSGLTQSLSKDGQTVPTANLPMGSFKHTGVANGSAVTDYAAVGQVQGGTLILLADTAGTNTVTTTATPTLTAYVKGQTFRAKLGGTCSGAVTLNIDSLGAKAVQKNQNALGSGDWTSGDFAEFVYDGTAFQLLSPARTPFIPSNALPLSILEQQAANTVVVNNTNATANLTVQALAASRLLGRKATGDITAMSLTDVLDLVGSAAWGDILFRGTAGWQRLAASTAGFFLKTNGAGADPSYAAVANGLVFLGAQTASNSAALSFTSLISSTYDKYLLEFDDLDIGASAVDIYVQVSTDNGSNWKTTGYVNNTASLYSGGATYATAITAGVALNGGQVKNTVPASGQVYLANPNSTTKLCVFNGVVTSYNNASSIIEAGLVMGYYNTTGTAINAVRLILSSGNLVSGIARLYGLQKS